jgi:hypothetical protein
MSRRFLAIWIVTFTLILLIVGCASQRKKVNCNEIRYRLDHVSYDDDQRQWIEEEWSYCMVEYDSLRKIDSVKYRGIYSQFDSIQIRNVSSSDIARSSSSEGTP